MIGQVRVRLTLVVECRLADLSLLLFGPPAVV
jgi:hypothetical protein